MAYRQLTNEEYQIFEDEYNKAIENLNKEFLIPKVFEPIENNLTFLGATAIEDKLQHNVGDCLECFIKTGGIKVWAQVIRWKRRKVLHFHVNCLHTSL